MAPRTRKPTSCIADIYFASSGSACARMACCTSSLPSLHRHISCSSRQAGSSLLHCSALLCSGRQHVTGRLTSSPRWQSPGQTGRTASHPSPGGTDLPGRTWGPASQTPARTSHAQDVSQRFTTLAGHWQTEHICRARRRAPGGMLLNTSPSAEHGMIATRLSMVSHLVVNAGQVKVVVRPPDVHVAACVDAIALPVACRAVKAVGLACRMWLSCRPTSASCCGGTLLCKGMPETQ